MTRIFRSVTLRPRASATPAPAVGAISTPVAAMGVRIEAIEYFLPQGRLTNEALAGEFENWTAEKIAEKTGIIERRVAAPHESAADLAVAACELVFERHPAVTRESIDYVLLCTQMAGLRAANHRLPAAGAARTPAHLGALDFNLGCSGFVYGLGLAKA